MLMQGAMALSVSLGVGYGVCVLASRQKAEMRTLGYALGIAILAIAFGAALIDSNRHGMKDRQWKKAGWMAKQCCPAHKW